MTRILAPENQGNPIDTLDTQIAVHALTCITE